MRKPFIAEATSQTTSQLLSCETFRGMPYYSYGADSISTQHFHATPCSLMQPHTVAQRNGWWE